MLSLVYQFEAPASICHALFWVWNQWVQKTKKWKLLKRQPRNRLFAVLVCWMQRPKFKGRPWIAVLWGHTFQQQEKTTACSLWLVIPTVAAFISISCAQDLCIHSDAEPAIFTIAHQQINAEVIQSSSTRGNCEGSSSAIIPETEASVCSFHLWRYHKTLLFLWASNFLSHVLCLQENKECEPGPKLEWYMCMLVVTQKFDSVCCTYHPKCALLQF